MPGDPIVIGPFVGGLNNISLAGESSDNEVTSLVNFEVGIDTALTSRPPISVRANSKITASGNDKPWDILGTYRVTNDTWYLLVQRKLGTVYVVQHALKGDFSTLTTINSVATWADGVSSFVQVDDYCYFVKRPGASGNGYKWKIGEAIAGIASMPKGNAIVSHKSRLWVAGTNAASTNSTLWFSTIDSSGPKFDTWNTSVDFFKVAPGEGGFITAMLSLNSSILIFKDDGTWRFSYARSPKEGQVDKVSGSIGASGPTSVVEFENLVYVYDKGKVYELINNTHSLINRTLDFYDDPSAIDLDIPSVDVSVVSRRLIIRYRNALYSYSLDTKTWSQWRSITGIPGRFYELPQDLSTNSEVTYIAASQGNTQNSAIVIEKLDSSSITYINSQLPSGVTATYTSGSIVVTSPNPSDFEVYLNTKGGASNFNVNAAPGRKLHVAGTIVYDGGCNVVITYKKFDGTEIVSNMAVESGSSFTGFEVPDGVTSASVKLKYTLSTQTTLTDIQLKYNDTQAPFNILELTDSYPDTSGIYEYIECNLQTKAYDYKAPSVHKRLFWWGIDHRSFLSYATKAIPITQKRPPLWKDLEAYTYNQLEQGTWGNPLSFLGISTVVSDSSEVTNTKTSNGRIFSKIRKALRFRQISYEITMITHGNKATGPCKIFSLTTYVQPKQKVVDKNS